MAELVHVHNRMNMNRRALVWPRPSHILTWIPRRPTHRLSLQAGYKSWRHPLAPKLPTSRYHIPASNQVIAVRAGDAQVASPRSKESPGRLQRGPKHPQPDQTYRQDPDQNQDQDLSQSSLSNQGWRHIYGLLDRPKPDRAALSHFSAPLNHQRINHVRTTRIQHNMHEWVISMCSSKSRQ